MSDPINPPPEGRTCAFCAWWSQEKGYEHRGGDCRKREPIITDFILSTDTYREKSKDGTWPLTKKDDWCGAFRSKPPEFIKETVKEAPQHAP